MSSNYWIGLSDSANEGTWLWLNGNLANPDDGSIWRPSYPRTGSSENEHDCAVAYFHNNDGGGLFFFDFSCSCNYAALSEKPV